ncbi:hypothetical protein Ancab_034444 [Ancistrocladus abbreviatus]
MEVKAVLHMTKGDGDFSYSQVSANFMRKLSSTTEHLLECAIKPLFSDSSLVPVKVFNAADVGCGVGAAPFCFLSTVVESVKKRCGELNREMPEIQIYLNDLAGNDFNLLFKQASGFGGEGEDGGCCFVVGAPGSFHGRLFPRNSLHLLHSCYSVHWLSQVPPQLFNEEGKPVLNKQNIYISRSSSPAVAQAYLAQFQQDFRRFVECRAVETVANGCMVLKIRGKTTTDPLDEPFPTLVLAEAISQLVSEGIVERGKVESFNIPFYYPAKDEAEAIIHEEGSFSIEQTKIVVSDTVEGIQEPWAKAINFASQVRSFTESLVSHHFGYQISDQIYERLKHVVFAKMTKGSTENATIVMALRRKMYLVD